METLYDLAALPAARDPGRRGLAAAARPDLQALAQTLVNAPSVLIVTGFPILAAGIGETDGPPGAADLASALCDLNKKVWVVTDELSLLPVKAACARRAPGAEVLEAPLENGEAWCERLLDRIHPAHIIAIERPGKGADGHFHNSKGAYIDALLSDTDLLVRAHNVPVTAVGDGGNELGMGALYDEIARLVPRGAEIAAVEKADFTVTAGVSNWGGLTICAALSILTGRDLLPTEEEETAMLTDVVDAGAVDGVTCERTVTVDGLSLQENLSVLRALRLCAAPAVSRGVRTLPELTPHEARLLFREGGIVRQTSGMCAGYTQCNLIVLPAREAEDFRRFAAKNRFACPVLEETQPGARMLRRLASDADAARDFPLYRIYEHGTLTRETPDVSSLWRDDFVAFLIGCSFSFEEALLRAGLPVRHIEENRNVPMYLSGIPCESAGIFHGNMVVSMRPMTPAQALRAAEITARMPRVHGAPVQIGDPEKIGIRDLSHPDFGDAVTVREGEVPVFWPCGVTPQAAVMAAKPAFAITHAPGHMLICDLKNQDLME